LEFCAKRESTKFQGALLSCIEGKGNDVEGKGNDVERKGKERGMKQHSFLIG